MRTTETTEARRTTPARRRWLKRLLWFVALWALGVVTLGAAAWLLRGAMHLAGMSSPS